jgi:molecular chaperone GrpE
MGRNGPDEDRKTPVAEESAPGADEARPDETSGAEPRGLSPVDPPESAAESLDALRRERDELKDRLLRRGADFENYRKRVERDRQQAGQDATATVLKALVPTLDNLDRALGAEASEGSLREGVELIRRDLHSALAALGLTVEDPLGQKFDPLRHQALAHEPVPGFEEGAIVEVLRKGYSLRDRLIRPALVKVARGDGDVEGGSDPEKVH